MLCSGTRGAGPADVCGLGLLQVWSVEAEAGQAQEASEERAGFHAIRTFEGRGRVEMRDGSVIDVPPASLLVTRTAETARWTAVAPGWRFWSFQFCCLGPFDAPVNRPLPVVEHRRDDEDFVAVVAGLSSPSMCYRQWASATFAGMFWRWMIGWSGRWNVPSNHRIVARVVERVYQRIGEDWSVARLAREEGVSERYLNQLFRDVVGEPPKRFLNRMRLLTAEQMLRFGKMSIKEVALDLGFSNASHFSTSFRAFFGESPREYLAKVQATRCGIQRESA